MKRRILAALLTACMLFGMTAPVLADEAGVPTPAPESSEAQETAEPTPTAEPTEAPTEEPTATPEDTATPTPEASAAPAEVKTQAANDGIAVQADSSTTSRVYLYLKVTTNTKNWAPTNQHGWITLGYIDVSGLPSATDFVSAGGTEGSYVKNQSKYSSTYKAYEDAVISALQSGGVNTIGNIVKYDNSGATRYDADDWKKIEEFYELIDFSGLSGIFDDSPNGMGLLASNGATDYLGYSTISWHLDAYLDLTKYAKLTVNYLKKNSDGTYDTVTIEEFKDAGTTVTPSDYADKYENYRLVKASRTDGGEGGDITLDTATTLEGEHEYVVNLYYDPEYTVIYDYNDGETENEVYQYLQGDETSTPAPFRRGYEFLGWKLEGDSTGTLYESSKVFNVTGNMTFTAQWRRKTIDPAISIDDWKYDGSTAGSAQHPLTAVLDIDGQNVEPDTIEWYDEDGNKLEGAPKDAGTYKVKAIWDGTEDYDGTFRETTFTISKRVVTIESGSDNKTYDGTPLTKDGTTVTGDGFVGDEATSKATGSVTDVAEGKVSNTIEVTPADGVDLDRNYTIVKKPGELYIEPKSIKPDDENTPEDEKTGISVEPLDDVKYNGDEQKQKPEVKDSKTGKTLEEGKDYDLVYSSDVTNVGEVTVTVKGKGNYTDTVDVKYNITKRLIHLVSESGSRTYNGKPFTKPDVIESGDGFVKDEGFASCTATGSVTTVEKGKVTNTIEYVLNGKTNSNNYTITTEEGKLWVTANTGITVGELEDVTYNGNEQKQEPKVTDNDGNELVKGKDYELVYPDDVTNSGEVTVKVVGKGNFDGATGETTYGIVPRRISLKSGDDHKIYDGTPLTKPGVTVGGDGIVNNDAAAEATGSVTEVAEGKVANTIQLTKNSPNFDRNYSIIDVDEGELYIEPKSIKPDDENTPEDEKTGITVEPLDDVKYNGNEQKQKPEVKDSKTGKTLEEGKDYDLVYSNDVTNVGEVTVTVVGKGNYKDTADVKYNITKRKVVLESNTKSKVYDGTPLTDKTVTVSGDGFVNNDAIVKATGSVTEVAEGKVSNTIEVTPTDAVLFERNYTVEKKPGELSIDPKSIKPDTDETPEDEKTGITVEPLDDVKYNGDEQKQKPEVKDSKTGKTLEEGKDYDLVYSNDVTNVGEVTVTVVGKGNYTDTVDVKYNITKRKVVLESNTKSKVYDGTPLTDKTVTVSGDGFVNNDAIVKATGSVTEVAEGKVTNTIEVTPTDAELFERNYTVEKKPGELSIDPKSIKPDTDETPEDEKTGISVEPLDDVKYNGDEQKQKPEVKDSKTGKTLEEGKDYDLVYSNDVTNVGEVTVTVVGKGNYKDTAEVKYNITKRNVVLESNTKSKVYDGTPLTDETVTVSGDGFVNNDATVKATGSVTEVAEGKVTNTIEVTPTDAELFERNYTVEKKPGELSIDPKSIKPDDENTPEDEKTGITVEPLDDVKYNGDEQKQKPEVKDSKTGKTLEEGKDYDLVYSNDVTNVGEVTVTVVGKGNYKDTVDVKYNITKRVIHLVSESGSRTYNGEPFTKPDVAKSGDGFVKDEGFASCTATGSVTDVAEGKVTNTIEYVLNGKTNSNNYTITTEEGKLWVTANTGINVGDLPNIKYDGGKHELEPEVRDANTDKVLVKGKDYDLSYSEDTVNVGSVTVTVTGKGNYAGAEGSTSYSILKREITLTSGDDHKVYDGTPLTKPGVTVGGDGIVNDDATAKATGSVTEVAEGKVTNTIEITPKDAVLFERNYSITTITEGKLYIEPKSIKPDDENTPEDEKTGISVEPLDDVKYNGEKQKQKPEVKDSKTGKTLEEGKDYDLVYSDDVTNVGEVTVTVVGKGNYKDTAEVKYNITKRNVVLESNTKSKVYDGTPLTDETVTVTGDGFVNNDATVKATGSVTEVAEGKVTNTIEVTPTDAELFERNYTVEKKPGELSIDPKSIKPDDENTPEDEKTGITVEPLDDVKYNGDEQKQKPEVKDSKTGKTLEEGKDYDLVYSNDVTNVGEVTVTVVGKGNYKDTAEVKYNITKRKVILESATDKKIYDRTPLTNNRVTTSGDGFANGEGFYCKVTGTITDVGSVENAFTAYPTENTKAENYEVEYVYGTLTVEPKSIANPDTPDTPEDKKTDITVTPPDDTTYNGKEQKKDPVVKHGDKVLEKGKDYDLSYSEDVTNPGTVTVTITGKGNYTEVTTVTYKILPVKEEKPAKPNKPDAAKRPKTGSSNLPAAAAAGAMLASGAGIAVLLRRKKKDEK